MNIFKGCKILEQNVATKLNGEQKFFVELWKKLTLVNPVDNYDNCARY